MEIKSYKIHFCLITEPLITNITPTLHRGFKPELVIILVPKNSHKYAHNLSFVFKKHHIKTEILTIANAWDIQLIKQTISDYLLEKLPSSIILNVSGGTKPMAIAAYDIFSSFDYPVFYVDQDSDNVHYLYQKKREKAESFQLEDKIDLCSYLLSYGVETTNKINPNLQIPKIRQKLCVSLIKGMGRYQKLLAKINYYAAKAYKTLRIELNESDYRDINFIQFIDLFEEAGVCKREQQQLIFKDEESRFYCNGGWFEEYVFVLLRSMKKELLIQDITLGLKVKLPEGSENEIDIAFLANNKLYLVECKTKKLIGNHSGQNGSEVIYKLDTLMSYAGVETKGLLVSYQDLSDTDKQRASDYEIMIVADDELVDLKKSIRAWVND